MLNRVGDLCLKYPEQERRGKFDKPKRAQYLAGKQGN